MYLEFHVQIGNQASVVYRAPPKIKYFLINGPTWASFCLFLFFFKQKFYRKNSTCQRDSNSDCRRRRQTTTTTAPVKNQVILTACCFLKLVLLLNLPTQLVQVDIVMFLTFKLPILVQFGLTFDDNFGQFRRFRRQHHSLNHIFP